MRQASQRHTEESAVIKKVQKEAAKEIENVKTKEEQEKKILESQLRNFEIENAFKEDVEISIQRAAQAMTEAYSVKVSASFQDGRAESGCYSPNTDQSIQPPQMPHLNRKESMDIVNLDLQEKILQQEIELSALSCNLDELHLKDAASRKNIEALSAELCLEKKINTTVRSELQDEKALRRDIEAELNIIVSREADAARQADTELMVATDKRVKELQKLLTDHETQTLELTRKLLLGSQELEKSKNEIISLRSSLKGMKKLENENQKLSILSKELRKTSAVRNNDVDFPRIKQKASFELPPELLVVDKVMFGKYSQ